MKYLQKPAHSGLFRVHHIDNLWRSLESFSCRVLTKTPEVFEATSDVIRANPETRKAARAGKRIHRQLMEVLAKLDDKAAEVVLIFVSTWDVVWMKGSDMHKFPVPLL